jgi:chorismate synthase
MAGNSFGQLFRITTFGESHGPAIGVVIDGCPAGLVFDQAFIQLQLSRRRPGQSALTTQRDESDQLELLSGVFEGRTTGTPITLLIRNKDAQSGDYDALKDVYRPSHADYTYEAKYGIRDHRGGGRSSARETAARVAAGGLAQLLLHASGIRVVAYVCGVGSVTYIDEPTQKALLSIENNAVRCPDTTTAARMEAAIAEAKAHGDSLGGMIRLLITGVPAGLGEPVFDKLEADLAKAMLSINAVKGFEVGAGFAAAMAKGSEMNDSFYTDSGRVRTRTNHSGGIQGGISNGETISCRIAFKPVATIQQKQNSIDKAGKSITLEAKGRHDPCVVPRAVPIVEAMAALVLADHLLRQRSAIL